MAHFDYIKPGGTWGLLSLLSSAIMAEIDSRIYKAINGDEGGVWAPNTTAIIIGGLGLEVTGPLVANDADIKFLTVESGGTVDCQVGSIVTLAGATTISGTLAIDVAATVTCDGTVDVTDGTFTFGGNSLVSFQASTVLLSTLNIATPGAIAVGNLGNITWTNGAVASYQSGSTTTFASGSFLTVNGTLTQGSASAWTLNGAVALGSTAAITTHANTTITISCKPTLSGGFVMGGWVLRATSVLDQYRHYDAPSGDTFVSRETYDVLKIPGNLGASAEFSYKISTPLNTLEDDQCVFFYVYRGPTTDLSKAHIRRGDNTLIATFEDTPTPKSLILIWSKSDAKWEIFSFSGAFTTDVST